MQLLHTLPITLTGNDTDAKREEVRSYFHKTFELFEYGFEIFKDDSVFQIKSEPTRHPMIFYFGHTATFFINKLIQAKVIDERINPEFESLFAIGVDEMSWDQMDGSGSQWPEARAVREYRNQVRSLVDELISTLPLTLPIKQSDPFWIILMGIEHERIHIETSSVLHRQLPIERLSSLGSFPCAKTGEAPVNTLVDISGAEVNLGKGDDHHLYGWDNEYGVQAQVVEDFKTSKYLVSNAEFMTFVDAGGYDKKQYWDEEGLAFLEQRQVTHPVFWVRQDNGVYKYRCITHVVEMPMNWPVDINCLEAQAFCRWKSELDGKAYRLPTEAEWYCLYEQSGIQDVPHFDDKRANINLKYYASSCPVDEFAFGDVFDVVGNVWQWTETAIDGFDGFKVHPAYDDFSTPTFDGKHNIMKGGSWASTGNEIMKHSRYAFRRHFYQHAGFRYVQGESKPNEATTVPDNIYETDSLVSQYCEFQYGESYFGVKNFAVACAEAVSHHSKGKLSSALDLGCATGRATFELARYFDRVTGVDFSARFIQVGAELQKNGKIRYQRAEEGCLSTVQECHLDDLGLASIACKVEFWQGDACNLKSKFTAYDAIMATNLIDRLYEPQLFLNDVHKRLNDGGLLVLTSPYTWLEEYTKPKYWLGGYTDDSGTEVSTLMGLKRILELNFDLIETKDVEFVIRETPRKYQHSIAHMSIWRKKPSEL